jgi:hypothetical protein
MENKKELEEIRLLDMKHQEKKTLQVRGVYAQNIKYLRVNQIDLGYETMGDYINHLIKYLKKNKIKGDAA